jgi:hypothetical protein
MAGLWCIGWLLQGQIQISQSPSDQIAKPFR